MWSSKAFLGRCEKLKELGVFSDISTGTRVARGFADLGYEEFYCLSNKKLVSVFTGHVSDFTPEHQHFFFTVPGVEGLVDAIAKKNFNVDSFTFVDQRTWAVVLRHAQNDERVETRDRELVCALSDALIQIAGSPAA